MRMERGDEVLITPSMFLIGQMLAMWPMSSFHSPHLQQPHRDFEIPYIARNPMIFVNKTIPGPAVASRLSVWVANCLS